MSRPYDRYWGKADAEFASRSGVPCHLAALHMLDVAAVAERQVEQSPILRARIGRMLGVAGESVAATVAAFVALHDIGKLDMRFQAKAPEAASALGLSLERKMGIGFDHGAGGFGHLLRELDKTVERELGAGAWHLLQAVTGHHGELPKRKAACDEASWGEARNGHHKRADRAARDAWLADVVALFRERGAVLPIGIEPTAPFVMQLAGLCSVADWIGSSTDFFPYSSALPDLASYYRESALSRADVALRALALRGARPSGRAFADLFENKVPRDVQRVTEALDLPAGPCLVVIEAAMGSGKTEAALDLAERFLARGDASGIFFALPTMATSNAMLGRLERDAAKMFEGKVNLVLSHGRRRMNERFGQILERRGTAASPYADEATVVCNRWLLGRKRALLGQVGVGTVDQAMLAALRVRHHFVRVHGLSESVVVIDEVHAYDAYMGVIIDRLVEWLGALGAPVILLSATLPAATRRSFVEAYSRGAGLPLAERALTPAPYPLVTCVSGAGATEHTLDAAPADRRVEMEVVATDAPEAALLPRLIEAARAGAMVAWIRNTVTDAQRAWDEAKALGAGPLLFHARMRMVDRAQIEEKVLADFGQGGAREGALLIATQVVEQSLDLDFDLLASDLAPVDLLFQRAGRLHRHARDRRPRGCEVPRLLVITPPADDAAQLRFGGSGHVYDRATLALTLGLLEGRAALAVPRDIRALVEAIYDDVARASLIERAPNRAALEAAEDSRREKLEKRRLHAQRACIPPAAYDPVAAESYGDDDDEAIQAFTRDGESTTLLPLLWDGEEGRPLEGGEPWASDPKAPGAWDLARELIEQTVSVPAYPWERVERGARARGEAAAWEEWLHRMDGFLSETGQRGTVLVPMRAEADGLWRGSVQMTDGKLRRLAYSIEKGLWFVP
jgi:CRISPR-associated endonuclease/helicase Cas3